MIENTCNLYHWLKEKNMSIKEFCEKIGCNRQIPRNVQCGKPISLKIALAIRIFTQGTINPVVKNVGRPKNYKQFHNVTNE